MIDCDQWLAEREGQRLGKGDADQERSGEPRSFRDGDGVQVSERDVGLTQRGADHRDDVAEVLAGGELRDYASVGCVRGDLGRYDVG